MSSSGVRRPFVETPLQYWGDVALMALFIMEAFWISDWYQGIVAARAGWETPFVFFALVLIFSNILARWSAYTHLKIGWRRLLAFLWILFTILAGYPTLLFGFMDQSIQSIFEQITATFLVPGSGLEPFWHIVILALAVYRGMALAHEPIQVSTTQASFQLGLFLLLLFGLIYGWDRPAQAILTSYGFLFSAIIAMCAARISTLSDLRGGRLPPLQAGWIAGIVIIASLTVAAAAALGWLSTTIAADAINLAINALILVAVIIGLILLAPVILLILSLGPTLHDLLEILANIKIFESFQKVMQSFAQRLGITPEWIEGVLRVGQPTVLFSILAAVFVIILVALVWKPWERALAREENASTLPLRAALRFPRLFLKRLSGRLPSRGRLLAAARIRWVYAQLMDLCSRLGKPRASSATPLEFLPIAQSLFTGEEETLVALTRAYLKVRYGELPETYEEVQAVLYGWERLKQQGSQIRAALKKSRQHR